MSNVLNLQTAFAGNDNHCSGYRETHPISAEALDTAMRDMLVATFKIGEPGLIDATSLTSAYYRNQHGGGYREMQPICERGHAAAMNEMYVTALRAQKANVGSERKPEVF